MAEGDPETNTDRLVIWHRKSFQTNSGTDLLSEYWLLTSSK